MSGALHAQGQAPAPARTQQRLPSTKASPTGLRHGGRNDSHEHEADRAAKEVTAGGGAALGWSLSRMATGGAVQRKCACSGSDTPCDECEKKQTVQRKAADAYEPAEVPSIVYEVLKSPGAPLDRETRAYFEQRFGHDFSRVQVHTDPQAAESARAIHAQAATVGQDIIFAQGKYAPETEAGRNLLAHELAHTIQQGGVRVPGAGLTPARDAEYHHLEREAGAAAEAVRTGGPVKTPAAAAGARLSRAEEEDAKPDYDKTPAPEGRNMTLTVAHESYDVTATETFKTKKKGTGKNEGIDTLEEFTVAPFYLPAEKGANAYKIYKKMADAKGLEATLTVKGKGRTKTAMWQERKDTDNLRDLWRRRFGWPRDKKNLNSLWKERGGDATFPEVRKETCEMDHIVELQLGGNNTPENIQVLDKGPNRSSGAKIKSQLQDLAKAIGSSETLGDVAVTHKQVKMIFTSVKQTGEPPELAKDCPANDRKATCLDVEQCVKLNPLNKAEKEQIAAGLKEYTITAGGRQPTDLLIPKEFGANYKEPVDILNEPENKGAATLIPGLLLETLKAGSKPKKPNIITAKIENNTKKDGTRIPISLAKEAAPIALEVIGDGTKKSPGVLKLDAESKLKTPLAFTYKYLSPGKITKIGMDAEGKATWSGTITPSIPFLGPLEVAYANDSLTVSKGLEEETLKKRRVLGMQLTKAQVQMQLGPDFKPEGVLEMRMGSEAAPLANASLKLSGDDVGLVAEGKLKVNIPKLKNAESDITYKGGGGRNEWQTEIHIASDTIKLPSASVDGQFDGKIKDGKIDFAGQINATFPGDNKATLGLKKSDEDWVLSGEGIFHVPKLKPTKVKIDYFLGKDLLVAKGRTGFTIPALDTEGTLEEVRIELGKDLNFAEAKVSGTGKLDFKKGKAGGHVDVTLHTNGQFTGKGTVTYQLTDKVLVTGEVELDEKQKLLVKGELKVASFRLFEKHEGHSPLIPPFNLPLPIPGLSIGDSGLVCHIRGGVGLAYSFGPGVIEPLIFSGRFYPLEPEVNPQLGVTGTVKVGAEATLSALLSGSLALEVDILVGSAGIEGGLNLEGHITLKAGAYAKFEAAYKESHLSAKVEAGMDTSLLLGAALTAFVRAYGGAFGFSTEVRKDWILAKKEIDTGVGLHVSAPFGYDDVNGIKLPETKDINITKPEVDFQKILGRLVNSTPVKETKKD